MQAKDVPSGFRRWPLHWFVCPSCNHRSHASVGQVVYPVSVKTPYRFWCARCGDFSVLRYPRRKGWVAWITLILTLSAFLTLAPDWLASGATALVVFSLVWLGLNRWTNEYVPDRKIDSPRKA